MSELIRCIFAQSLVSQALGVVALVALLVAIGQVCRILAIACVNAARSWMLVARYTRRAALARAEARRARERVAKAPNPFAKIR